MFRQGSNRLVLPGLLHRISAVTGMDGEVMGLTYRFARWALPNQLQQQQACRLFVTHVVIH